MTKDIDPAKVRTMWSYGRPFITLMPLGCFYVGQVLDLPQHGKVTVTSIDPDGAAVARSDEQMKAMTDAGRDPYDRVFRSTPGWTLQQQFASRTAQERVQAGMTAQQERNRREHGVELPADLAAAA